MRRVHVETFDDVANGCDEDGPLYTITTTSNQVEKETVKQDGTFDGTTTFTAKVVAVLRVGLSALQNEAAKRLVCRQCEGSSRLKRWILIVATPLQTESKFKGRATMRRDLHPRLVLLTLAGFLLVTTLQGCSSSQTSQQGARLSSACQTVRSRFVEMENKSIKGTQATIDALNHYSDAFNGVTSGRVPSGSPQYQATMNKMQADKRAAINAQTASQQKGSSFRAAIARCDTATLPKGCLAEWDHFRVRLKHEVREQNAGAAALKAATNMVAVWNAAGARTTPATNAAVSQYNVALDALSATVDVHDRLTDQYRTVQEACTKAAQG